MCHEMGHGLGLGHADTNFHERRYGDLYGQTNRPENNLTPNRNDFIKLGKLYGGKKFLDLVDEEKPGLEDSDVANIELKTSAHEEEEMDLVIAHPVVPKEQVQNGIYGDKNKDDNERGGWHLIYFETAVSFPG
eukprot:CAMPEP_0113319372 /NCGR_PEP_ID=MMETSP0010_2-20120614/13588_1 /TAXON_ID=216773 ORGANISM="Corethron hystrix, Strain 308" /NCGR_SAMPLE_ID=MMETSP0010_2 /ASSEMBLY_ACC=CAM_ASM_000155 /LENGTH=132 /DNA_ID=CAMNT_0000176903 /DNA_START=11 /DNA_END=410 /DNA_ORIENTATION=+ /assembly_acc=CAM_ASM_000155